MATAETATRPHDRHSRRRPFTSWMKRLASLKSTTSPQASEKKAQPLQKTKRHWNKNNPYPESGVPASLDRCSNRASRASTSQASERASSSFESADSVSAMNAPIRSNKSAAPTLATNAETIHSDAGQSKATASTAITTSDGRANSVFSSPQHSQESLTTTLTTIQSTAPTTVLTSAAASAAATAGSTASTNTTVFSHQYPIAPPSALPAHLAPQAHPHTYIAATANGLLTDDASILTLASSSKRQRRHSLDTDASTRALAPSSLFGNSRESLPLSVLSSNMDTGGLYQSQHRPSVGGLASAERASVYSASGIGPVVGSERNSYYAGNKTDGGSVRSGLLGHGRAESVSGSITGIVTTSPGGPMSLGRLGRRGSEEKDESYEEEGSRCQSRKE
ncbi:hypothetical protein EJ06DRAFT_583178 [Trichodelitschia bisporula]|uniref:Uncharacterized protein n=1 Tax=Trichodelitschia bisporula TaxID=703511 RepID=A0A6G1HT92_9PEZI|nr:hypothetical protein EJ06DRAFT_583178 [Trichodelitschia bisporula]